MKKCITCNIEKDISEFGIRSDTGKHRNTCKGCSNITSKRTRNKKTDVKKLEEIKRKNKDFMTRVKSFYGCSICMMKYPECLDFHHLDPNTKEHTPSSMFSKSRESIKDEIRKCMILCSNHHRMVHSGRLCLIERKKG